MKCLLIADGEKNMLSCSSHLLVLYIMTVQCTLDWQVILSAGGGHCHCIVSKDTSTLTVGWIAALARFNMNGSLSFERTTEQKTGINN